MIEICKREDCTGCMLCAQQCKSEAISIVTDNLGFIYPIVDNEKCVKCHICQKTCVQNNFMNINFHDGLSYFGAYEDISSMSSLSSSGGFANAASYTTLLDGGIVYGAAFNDEWYLQHCRISDCKELFRLDGSKYAQSDISHVYQKIKNDLSEGLQVLFIGTPCQVASVLSFIPDKYRDNLLTIDFICHGVPSPSIVKDYINHLETLNGKVESYNFRSKDKGWTSKHGKTRVSVRYLNGKIRNISSNFVPIHYWFAKHMSLRESCFNCKFRNTKRVSDITIADFWHLKDFYPNVPEKQGVSAVQINTLKGQSLFNRIPKSLSINVFEVSRESIWFNRDTDNSVMTIPKNRREFSKCYHDGGISELIKKFPAPNSIQILKIKVNKKLNAIIKGGR